MDDLIELTQIPARRVLSALTMLELDGYVAQSGGKRFCVVAVSHTGCERQSCDGVDDEGAGADAFAQRQLDRGREYFVWW